MPTGGVEPSGFAQTGYAGTSLLLGKFFGMQQVINKN
jgi:hypothetical protein